MPARHNFSISRFLIIALAVLSPLLPAAAHNGADAVFSAPQAPTAGTPVVAVSGTVADLIVDNRVTVRFHHSRPTRRPGCNGGGLQPGQTTKTASTSRPVQQ